MSVPLIHQRDENSNAGRPKIQENEKCSTKGNSTFAWPHGHHASRAPPPPGVWLPDATVRAARGRRLGSAAGLVPRVLHPKKRAFLAAFSRCGSISQSAKRAKVDRRTPYNWLREDVKAPHPKEGSQKVPGCHINGVLWKSNAIAGWLLDMDSGRASRLELGENNGRDRLGRNANL